MVALQIISKILQSKDFSIIDDNLLTVDYFVGFEDEFNFIADHYREFGNVPDIPTFLASFNEFEIVEVTESDRYLINTIREEYLYYKSVPVIQKAAELLKTDSNAASEYLFNALKDLQPNYDLGGTDIIKDSMERYDVFCERKNNQDNWFFTTGFPELDDLTHGIQRGEELMVIVARTNQGKSWVLEKMCTHVWELGFNVGYISPEMGAINIGYRFDTLHNNFSNNALVWGNKDFSETDYKTYIEELKTRNNAFLVATPQDFKKQITVTKLKNWATKYKLDMIAVDGITYMTDERYKRNDNKTTSLTNISEDLMSLSMELKIPIVVVVQANRGGVVDKESNDTPELESIRDSDGIAHNASKVISIRQNKDNMLVMQIKKQRFGPVGGKLMYQWNIDTGEFIYSPNFDDDQPVERAERQAKRPQNKEDVF